MGLLQEIFGSKPVVPNLPAIDVATEQQKAAANNLAIEPQAQKLAGLTADEIDRLMAKEFPNFADITKTATTNIDSLLHGEIPQDVQDAVMRSSAGRALTGGYGGTGMGNALTARDLGLTSLSLSQTGLSSAESWLKSTERLYAPALATYTGMFVSPEFQLAADTTERNTQFEHSWLKAQVAAMPDPATHAVWQVIHQIGMMALGMVMGSPGAGAQAGANSPQGYQPAMGPQSNVGRSSMGYDSFDQPGGAANSWYSGPDTSTTNNFGAPITSPGMGYDSVGAGGASPIGSGAGFGAPITSPGMGI